MVDKAKVPNCDLQFVVEDGKVKVKATCQDMADAMDLKEILDQPVTITVQPKAEIK